MGNVLVFDIGGTWFRSARVSHGKLIREVRLPAVSIQSHPYATGEELLDGLGSFFARCYAAEAKLGPIDEVVVSLGAAMDEARGLIYQSGPLWGTKVADVPVQCLAPETPSIPWRFINDVSAMASRHQSPEVGRFAILLLSTGTALRTFDQRFGVVTEGPTGGLQGEIGHLPVNCTFEGRRLDLPCDCGGTNHLSSFASGRGLARVLTEIGEPGWADDLSLFARATHAGHPRACAVLRSVCAPLAQVLVTGLTFDPGLEAIYLCGGLASGLDSALQTTLVEQLQDTGLYLVSDRQPDYFEKLIRMGKQDDHSGLIGAYLSSQRSTGVLL